MDSCWCFRLWSCSVFSLELRIKSAVGDNWVFSSSIRSCDLSRSGFKASILVLKIFCVGRKDVGSSVSLAFSSPAIAFCRSSRRRSRRLACSVRFWSSVDQTLWFDSSLTPSVFATIHASMVVSRAFLVSLHAVNVSSWDFFAPSSSETS